jgi:uncharacterized protein YbcV (DUF1398 family)
MNTELIDRCVGASFAGAMTFPEVVQKLAVDGVEWYSANLVLGASTHYAADGTYHQMTWPPHGLPPIADQFDAERVQGAIRAIQKREIVYTEFLDLIAEGGTVYYTVHITGRKAIYFGRHGDFHIENFPQ